ncbi:hypothetical protein BFR39_04525 [Brochothrix thermosphacta]|nr:hypothetical protein BFR39_04525 [Brochothrix thermosphacta]
MSNLAKKYYWLKLDKKFFNNPEIKILRRIAGGDTYTLIYLEMMLLSLENDGYLFFEGMGENISDEIAVILNEEKENVDVLLAFLKSKKLIEINETNDELYINTITEMIGTETESARKMRRFRTKESPVLLEKGSHCDSHVTECDTEKEIELEKELEKEKDIVPQSETIPPYKTIIDYLNDKAGTKYRSSSKDTQKHIKARFNNSFTLEDFKTVIDNKVFEWGNNSKMSVYLRPKTLFGTKFESYLNQKGGGESAIFSEDDNKFSNAPVTDDDTLPF